MRRSLVGFGIGAGIGLLVALSMFGEFPHATPEGGETNALAGIAVLFLLGIAAGGGLIGAVIGAVMGAVSAGAKSAPCKRSDNKP